MIILIDAEKKLTKSNIHLFQLTINKGELLQLDKEHLQKPIASIILNGEKLEVFSLIARTRQECSLSSLLLK